MAYEGSLSATPFPEVLQTIGRNAETGILTLQGKDEIIGVTFLDGEVVSVDAVNQAPEDGLGQVLDERGLVSLDRFSSLVAENQAGGGRVIDLLVERGYIERAELLTALRTQTLRLCEQACAWTEGQFRFYSGDKVSYEHGIEPIDVDDLLHRLASGEEPPPRVGAAVEDDFEPDILRLEDMDDPEVPEIEMLDLPPVSPPAAPAPAPIEMPDPEPWDEEDDLLDFDSPRERRPWFDFGVQWDEVIAPFMPGRALGIGMLVSLAALIVLAPERFLVPLEGQERIRDATAAEVRDALFHKVDQAAKTYFLLRGAFPDSLPRLVEMGLLAKNDVRVTGDRMLSYTPAPVSYLLSAEGYTRGEATVWTESIGGSFLLDPDFSPPEAVDKPPLVLLD